GSNVPRFLSTIIASAFTDGTRSRNATSAVWVAMPTSGRSLHRLAVPPVLAILAFAAPAHADEQDATVPAVVPTATTPAPADPATPPTPEAEKKSTPPEVAQTSTAEVTAEKPPEEQ